MTLIEIMLVIAIVAMLTVGASMGIGALTQRNLRSACTKVVAGARYAYNRAIIHDRVVRLRFDLETEEMVFEEAAGGVTLTNSEEQNSDVEGQSEAVDPWEVAQQRVDKPEERTQPPAAFEPLKGDSGKPLKRYAKKRLANGVDILKVIVPHSPEPHEEGEASVYFFPGGRTEAAVIQLSTGASTVYSVRLEPLTGKGRIYTHPVEVDDLEKEEQALRDTL